MDWPQPQPGRAKGSLIFAGGRGDFIEKYLEALAHWHGEGWNVTAFDWRGQGGSRGTIDFGHLDSLDPLVDDLAGMLADWRGRTPGPHVAIAHSLGGHVLLRAIAERETGRETGLGAAVLVAPMLMINSGPVPPWGAEWIASGLSILGLGRRPAWERTAVKTPTGSIRQKWLTSSVERYGDELHWWSQTPEWDLGAPSWGWIDAAYRSIDRLTPAALGRVITPVLLLAARNDRLVSTEAIEATAPLIPDAELIVFERSGHEILREADRVRLAALSAIDEFLARKLGQ